MVSCLKSVSKLHIRRPKIGPKSFFINPINWTLKCLFGVGDLRMGKLRNFGLLMAVLAIAPLQATTLQKLSLPEMARRSTAVIRARVVASSGVLRGSGVYTVYKLNPVEVWKAPASGAPAEVAVPGGVAGGLRQPVDGAPALVEGHEYVLFLWTGRTGLTQLIGLSQGLFDVRATSDTASTAKSPAVTMVWRSPASERMLDGQGRPMPDEAVSMKLADLKTQVARALTAARESKGAR